MKPSGGRVGETAGDGFSAGGGLAGAVAGAGSVAGGGAGAGADTGWTTGAGCGFAGALGVELLATGAAGGLDGVEAYLPSWPVALRTAATNGSPPCGIATAPVRMV